MPKLLTRHDDYQLLATRLTQMSEFKWQTLEFVHVMHGDGCPALAGDTCSCVPDVIIIAPPRAD